MPSSTGLQNEIGKVSVINFLLQNDILDLVKL